MKHLLLAVVAILVVASVAFGQATGHGTSLKTGKTQGVMSGMIKGPHDFTADSGSIKGPSNNICGYCHSIHIPATGIPTPLWTRKSTIGSSWGVYSNPMSLDATPADPGTDDNYSAFCMGCHDGSHMFAASEYSKTPYVPGGWPGTSGIDTLTVTSAANMFNGDYGDLSHTHPVNFTYDAALVAKDPGLYDPTGKQYMYWDASYGSVGRLFNGKVQCSSCHNPHNNSGGILLEGSTKYGALCVACHKK